MRMRIIVLLLMQVNLYKVPTGIANDVMLSLAFKLIMSLRAHALRMMAAYGLDWQFWA